MVMQVPSEFGRNDLIKLISSHDYVLEIGPFVNPVVRGENVRYFDVLNREDLIARAEKIGRNATRAPEINFVSSTADLAIVNEKFDVCISSHCIEHQPDLIRHLIQVTELLKEGGRYLLMVPDKRYCFDHFIPPSTIADVLCAQGRTTHSLGNVIRHLAHVTHNDPSRHWKGDHGAIQNIDAVRRALEHFRRANGGYIDVHAWQFTPQTFRVLMDELRVLDLTDMTCEAAYATPYGSLEFCASLVKSTKLGQDSGLNLPG